MVPPICISDFLTVLSSVRMSSKGILLCNSFICLKVFGEVRLNILQRNFFTINLIMPTSFGGILISNKILYIFSIIMLPYALCNFMNRWCVCILYSLAFSSNMCIVNIWSLVSFSFNQILFIKYSLSKTLFLCWAKN